MAEKAPDIYQGEDWVTDRWSVAQVFDSLDRMQDICEHVTQVCAELKIDSLPTDATQISEATDLGAVGDLLGELAQLCDCMTGEIDAALADVLGRASVLPVQRWLGYEMHLYLQGAREKILGCCQGELLVSSAIEGLTRQGVLLAVTLKKIDQ